MVELKLPILHWYIKTNVFCLWLGKFLCFCTGGSLTYIFPSGESSITSCRCAPNLRKSIRLFFEKLYFKYLQVNPKDQRVILCESLLNPTKAREEMAHVLFTQFDVSNIFEMLIWSC